MLPRKRYNPGLFCRRQQPVPARVWFSDRITAPFYAATILLICLLISADSSEARQATPFPSYPVIEKNVLFWQSIYDTYSTSQAVIHDQDDVDIIYTVVPVFSYRLPGASQINRPILRGIKKRYSDIVKRLAQGIPPQNIEEQRVAKLFETAGQARLRRAADSIRVQIGQKDRFLDGYIRSGAYIDEIKSIFKKKGLPEDLAYLPHVESSFNVKAYSKFGASGIWQFTRSTGRQFLTINEAVDERQDPITASQAAATFLKENYTTLKNWPLAITAYNYGPAGAKRAQNEYGSYENIFQHYNQGYFKFASRNFYSEFLAALRVVKKLESDPSIKTMPPSDAIRYTLPAFMSAQDLSAHFKMTLHQLKDLNPALLNTVLQGRKYVPKGHTISIGRSNSNKKLLANIPSSMYHSRQKPTEHYLVKQGDTASAIALKLGVSLQDLKTVNNMDSKATVFSGQRLNIPAKDMAAKNGSLYIRPQLANNTKNAPVPLLYESKKYKSN